MGDKHESEWLSRDELERVGERAWCVQCRMILRPGAGDKLSRFMYYLIFTFRAILLTGVLLRHIKALLYQAIFRQSTCCRQSGTILFQMSVLLALVPRIHGGGNVNWWGLLLES